ncbi:cobalamin-dependent protein [Bacillus shivajii]|uniref:MerR family transcriptional regulator n=1 Tax=Bacillus shivajii TaxID=1983719 RepID=UPI001CFA2A0E|nr:cobalamin-dependent protein [Bacillus shivajii]UCZ54742.1 cobalamin-dependent protein [Bacillus shivajii]
MSASEGKYNIKAVTNMLGIQAGTLRAWERRYRIIEPIRNQAGHRLYTDKHVSILKWLIKKVNQGFTIGQAVDLLETEFKGRQINTDQVYQGQLEVLQNDLIESLLNFRESESNQILNQAFGMFSVETVVNQVLKNTLIEAGDMWERSEINTAHEHYITSYIRTKITNVFQSLPSEGSLQKVITVCAPNEQHEVGLLTFTLFLKRRGYETIYLGSGMEEKDYLEIIKELAPDMFFMSCTMSENLAATLRLVKAIENSDHKVKVGLGGHAIMNLPISDRKTIQHNIVGENEEDWVMWVKK